MFPVVVQYFTKEKGMNVGLLDLQSLPDEKSSTIIEMLIAVLNKNCIHKKCVAFSGDNCITFFSGKSRNGKNNVFTKLKNELTNDLIGIGCPAHILHNSTRFGFEGLPIDLECIIEKTYNHFSIYTVRNENAKNFASLLRLSIGRCCTIQRPDGFPCFHVFRDFWKYMMP